MLALVLLPDLGVGLAVLVAQLTVELPMLPRGQSFLVGFRMFLSEFVMHAVVLVSEPLMLAGVAVPLIVRHNLWIGVEKGPR